MPVAWSSSHVQLPRRYDVQSGDLILSLEHPVRECFLLFLESFLYCIDRDVWALCHEDAEEHDLETAARILHPAIEKTLMSPDATPFAKFMCLRAIDTCPLALFSADGPVSVVPYTRLLRTTNDPVLLYQTASSINGLVSSAQDESPDEWVNSIQAAELPDLLDAMSDALGLLQRESSRMNPADCTNAIIQVQLSMDGVLGFWNMPERFDPAEFRRYLVARAPLSMERMRELAPKGQLPYRGASLRQMVAYSFSAKQLYEGEDPLFLRSVGGDLTIGLHAFYARVQKVVLLGAECVFFNYVLEESMGPDGGFRLDAADGQRFYHTFYEFMRLMADDDFFAIITHERTLEILANSETRVMDEIVNGGHLDNGAMLKMRNMDFFAKYQSLRWKVLQELFNTYELFFSHDSIMVHRTEAVAETETELWCQLVRACHWTDSPVYLRNLEEEILQSDCNPVTTGRLLELLSSACGGFTNTLGHTTRLPSSKQVVELVLELPKVVAFPAFDNPTFQAGIDAILSCKLDHVESWLASMDESHVGMLSVFLVKDMSVCRMRRHQLERLIERRKAVLESISDIELKNLASIDSYVNKVDLRRDLETIALFFAVALVQVRKHDTHSSEWHYFMRPFSGMSEFTASLLDMTALALMHAGENDVVPLPDVLKPLVGIANLILTVWEEMYEDGVMLVQHEGPTNLFDRICTFLADCRRNPTLKIPDEVEGALDGFAGRARTMFLNGYPATPAVMADLEHTQQHVQQARGMQGNITAAIMAVATQFANHLGGGSK